VRPPFHPIVQIAYFVDDAQKAAAHAANTWGAGPFFFIEKIQLAWGEHKGKPQTFLHSSAYGQWGSLMLEFVQQDIEGPSPFRDMYNPGESGIHHMATMVDSLTDTYAHYENAGYDIAARAETLTGTEFAFINTVVQLGHMIEVYEKSPSLLGFYQMVQEASVDWSGDTPVRNLT
jgi:hypothetical protein